MLLCMRSKHISPHSEVGMVSLAMASLPVPVLCYGLPCTCSPRLFSSLAAHLCCWLDSGLHLCRLTFSAQVARRYSTEWRRSLHCHTPDTSHHWWLTWVDIGWTLQADVFQPLQHSCLNKGYAEKQFCQYLPTCILQLRHILPTTTDRHSCSPSHISYIYIYIYIWGYILTHLCHFHSSTL